MKGSALLVALVLTTAITNASCFDAAWDTPTVAPDDARIEVSASPRVLLRAEDSALVVAKIVEGDGDLVVDDTEVFLMTTLGEFWLGSDSALGSFVVRRSRRGLVKLVLRPPKSDTGIATVTATSGASASGTVQIAMRDTVPILSLSSLAVLLEATKGGTKPNAKIVITNTGAGTLRWSATTAAEWLMLEPEKGELAAAGSDTMTVTADQEQLEVGDHEAQIVVSSGTAEAQSETVDLSLSLKEASGGA